MKKLLATLLTGCLALQSCIGFAIPTHEAKAAAATIINPSTQSFQTMAVQASDSQNEDTSQAESALEIEVRSSLLFPYEGKVSIVISKDGKETDKQELELSSTSTSFARFDVPAGEYMVTILADKFAKYEQTVITEAGWIHKLLVCSTRFETETDANPGWIRPGDVNGDKVIDEKDSKALLSAIRKNPENSAYDLNNDGKADIADLQYLVQSLNEEQTSLVEKLRISKYVEAIDGTTVSGGAIEDVLKSKSITVVPSNTTQKISEENPIGLMFTLAEENASVEDVPEIGGITIQAPDEMDEDGNISSMITDGEVEVVYLSDNGKEQTQSFSLATEETASSRSRKVKATKTGSHVTIESNGSLVLDFGNQIAVKRVTIKITGIKKEEPLVNIAKVEFVNNMEERIPAPELDIPTLTSPESGNQSLTVSWNAQNNVTGYELYICGPVKGNEEESQVISVSDTSYVIGSINNNSLINFETYTIKVRSVNGDWRSPWSDEKTGSPKPQKKPAPPDNVKATGGYRIINVSWKDMDDANGYMVYYKKSEEADSQYQPVVEGFEPVEAGTGKIETNSYTITGLEDQTEYSVYVIGWNELGWGNPSLTSLTTTKSTSPPELPNYKLLNTSNGEGKVTSHIVSATFGGHGGAKMEGSALDTEAYSALGLVDDDYGSYWVKNDWDDGVAYPNMDRGMFITLDNDYKMNYLTFAATDEVASVEYVRIEYWNSETGSADNAREVVGARLIKNTDSNGNQFYIVKFDETVTVNKIHMTLGRAYTRAEMKVGEIHFHIYDSLEDDIMGLYADEMHTTLRDNVTAETIEGLETRLETVDEESGEKHPLYAQLKLELQTANEILNGNLAPSYEVINQITAKTDGHLGFSGLNAWQPLGKVAYSGEKLLVYVGHNTKRTGDSTNLQLVMTQYHSESNSLAKTVSLKVGRNEITVPQIADKDYERGGQLYVAYTGNSTSDKYAIRISGGSDIPVLNVYGKTGSERTNAIKAYIEELEQYVTQIESEHNAKHKGGEKAVDYDYDITNCILNATDIMIDKMMYSLPATQLWSPLKSATDKVSKLDTALTAMEDTMTLFYQHKGLSNDAGDTNGNNNLPSQHLNIRYMRMFAGAFMYAAGNHIGIEYGSSTLASGANSWNSFGWGVAHEIGHNINQGTYAIAEITNNYFAQLLTIETSGTRFNYSNVYKKVTSGTIGRASNGATQLALYWQLHLAFDNNKDDRYIFDNYEDQFNNLFFARVDTYSRNPSKAPQSGLTLDGDVDQNLMRLACAAANKNILPFFERWGMIPNEATIAYAEKYGDPDTKATYYVTDDARDYRADHLDEEGAITGQDVVEATASAKSNQVEITITTNKNKDVILGYEIIRSMTSNGKTESKVVGFQPIDTTASSTVFVDTISTINNRVMSYEVKAVDKYLNYSNAASAGSVKIQTDGVLDKTSFTVETNMTSDDDIVIEPDDDDPDSGYHETNPESVEAQKEHSIDRIIDNDKTNADGIYNGISTDTAEITIDMHEIKEITALKYQGTALSSVTVEVSENGDTWTVVKENYTGITGTEEQTIWFDSVKEEERQNWIGTYDARYVKLTIFQTGNISIHEIEICGPTGDNLEFKTAEDGQPAIGILTEDYQYGKEEADIIPKGSLIFTGTYKGNPAYNVVVLYDTEGNVIGAKDGNVEAKQVIFADVPEKGNLGETSDGTWVYYVEPGQWDETTLKNIQGVRGELYRVDDALTLEGERIVSDTTIITIPETLPDITFTAGNIPD